MTDDFAEEFYEELEESDQTLHCPACDTYGFVVSQLATVGQVTQLGITCMECAEPLATADLVKLVPEAQEQIGGVNER